LFSDTTYQENLPEVFFSGGRAHPGRSHAPPCSMVDAGAKKNSSDSQKSFEYDVNYIVKPGSDLSVPIFHRDGVGTLLSVRECDPRTSAGCQGFFGPFPSAFLDKRCS